MTHVDLAPVLELDRLPMMLGVQPTPSNGAGIPDVHRFELAIDPATSQLRQVPNAETDAILKRAYQVGSLLGTAMDDSSSGRPYGDDFLSFILRSSGGSVSGRRVLEIGAGRGYLVKRLQEEGAEVVGLEPGESNRPHWERHGVEIVADFFPSEQCAGPYDLIVAYAVLEHLADAATFLSEVARHLAPSGRAILAVPNDTPDIEAGDPAMLVHEHFGYFTSSVFRRVLRRNSLDVEIEESSGFGGALYVSAQASTPIDDVPTAEERALSSRYATRCRSMIERVERRVLQMDGAPLGVYCAVRGVNVLPPVVATYRFFDDDEALHGSYYPPFDVPVEGRSDLLEYPPPELWILSRTFGRKLQRELRAIPVMARTRILTINDLEVDV